MKVCWLLMILVLFFLTTLIVTACDDDDDKDDDAADDDDNDTADDDDNGNEEPCFTQAKLDAQEYCSTLGLEANLTHIGLNSAGGLTCLYYCGGSDYFLADDCLGGTCICCQ